MALDITSYLLGKKGSGGGASGLKVEVVQELPTTGETDILYLVPKTTTGTNNVFEEYLYVNDNWELIGTTDIDLSNYIQKSLTAGLVKNDGTIDTSTYLTQEVPEVYYVETTYNNPFIFDGKKKGIYYIVQTDNEYFYYQLSSTTSKNSLYYQRANYIILNNDFNYNTLERNIDLGIIETYSTNNGESDTGNIKINSFKVTNNDNYITLTDKMPYKLYMLTEKNQRIKGIKIFETPIRYNNGVNPSYDYQLANKGYVDDRIQQTYISCGLSAYSSSSTYAVGDYVYNGNTIYVCSTAIETAEAWDSTHWTVSNLKEYLTSELVGTALGGSY